MEQHGIQRFESVKAKTLDEFLEMKTPEELQLFITDATELMSDLEISINHARDVLNNGYGGKSA